MARNEALCLLLLVRQGVDPVEEARNAKRRAKVLNVSAYGEQFIEIRVEAPALQLIRARN
jgi:hypothetical protein